MSLYQPNPDFVVPCFWDFSYRFNSLYRHWQFSKDSTTAYTKSVSETPDRILKNYNAEKEQYFKEKERGIKHDKKISMLYEDDWSEELLLVHYENEHSDIEYFPEFLKGSILSMSLSLLETLLQDLSVEIAQDLEISVELPPRGSFLQRYLDWLDKSCGLTIEFSKETKKNFMAIGAVRNKYIHKLDRDLPEDIRKIIHQMVKPEENEVINFAFIEKAFTEIKKLIEKLESGYKEFYINLNTKN